jgi:hypothetical protein
MTATFNAFADRDAKRVARLVEARAKVLAPVDTGRLRGSIKTKRTLSIRGPQYTVYTNVTYAPYVENGTRPHVIRPKTKKALRFKIGGNIVIVAKVNHPGTRAQPFLGRAVREVGIANGYAVRID